jgi:uncharacterized protein (TIGR00725 family)
MLLDRRAGRLFDDEGRLFDPLARCWSDPAAAPAEAVGIERLPLRDAAAWLQRDSGHALRAPLGVIGPRAAGARQTAVAEDLGRALAAMGLTVLCGGKGGVMEAVCRGVAEAGGFSVGLLPDDSWEAANPYVSLPLASGLGVARNAVIARAAFCLVAVGGGYGTLSEIAFGLQFGRPVFTLAGAPAVAGASAFERLDEALDAVAERVLARPIR